MSLVDWTRYQKCPVCPAELGKPCLQMTGTTLIGPVAVEAYGPHGGRKRRAGATR